MATQIAPTPVLKGKEAYAVLEESKKKPSVTSKYGVDFLRNKFQPSVNDGTVIKIVTQGHSYEK